MSEDPAETRDCIARMTTDEETDFGALRLAVAKACSVDGAKFEIDAELLLDLIDDASTWASYERKVRSVPSPEDREIAVRGDGPYLVVMLDPYRGLTLTRCDSMRGVIAEGTAVLGSPTWQFEIKRELTWDQLFVESNFGFTEWSGFGEGRPDPTATASADREGEPLAALSEPQ